MYPQYFQNVNILSCQSKPGRFHLRTLKCFILDRQLCVYLPDMLHPICEFSNLFHKSDKYSRWCIMPLQKTLQKNDSRFFKKTSGCCLVREKVLLLVQSSALGRWTPIDFFFLSECHVHVAWITQEWPHCDPSNHLLRLGYASHSAHLPIWLPSHSTCQKQDRCP